MRGIAISPRQCCVDCLRAGVKRAMPPTAEVGYPRGMRGSDALARILKIEGVEVLFSYPNHPLIDAAAQLDIRPIIARGEKTLINMADGYARATNGQKPSVVVVQAGPGIENAFGAVAQAFSDGIPLLLIPGGPDQHRQGEPPQFDPLPVYRNVTRWAGRVNFADRITELARRAFAQIRNGKPGPVLLEVPYDVGNAEIDADTLNYTPARAYKSAGDPEDVAAAARMLLDAQRPVLHVGHGVLWAQASEELRQLAELLQVPVMTTMAAKSAFPEDHPLSLGAGGHTITRAAAHFLVKADLVFGIGCSFARGSFSSPIPAWLPRLGQINPARHGPGLSPRCKTGPAEQDGGQHHGRPRLRHGWHGGGDRGARAAADFDRHPEQLGHGRLRPPHAQRERSLWR